MPDKWVSAHASALVKPGQIWVTSGSDLGHYPDQWIIQVIDADSVLTLD